MAFLTYQKGDYTRAAIQAHQTPSLAQFEIYKLLDGLISPRTNGEGTDGVINLELEITQWYGRLSNRPRVPTIHGLPCL